MAGDARAFKSYTSLRTSLAWKRLICNVFLVAVTLYLPIGMYYVTDWVDYSKDVVGARSCVCLCVSVCVCVCMCVLCVCVCVMWGM